MRDTKRKEFQINTHFRVSRFVGCAGIFAASLSFTVNAAAAPVAQQGPTTVTMSNLWSLNIKGKSDSTVAIGNEGTLYLGTFAGDLWAVSPDGRRKWLFETKRVSRANMEIRSSPAIDDSDGTIYFGCRDTRLYAVAPDGQLKWTFKTGAWVDSSPTIGTNGTIYFGSWDKSFYALNRDGAKIWQFTTGGEIVGSSAVGADGRVFFGSHDGKFYALNPDGTKSWEFQSGAQIISSPAISAGGVVYFTSVNGFFYALKPDGSLLWKLHTGGITESSPVIAQDETIYVGVDNRIFGISPSGKLLWDQVVMPGPIQELVQASPVALADGGLYVLSRFGNLVRWDPNRKPVEKFYLYGSGYASPSVAADGTVYIMGTWTNLHALIGNMKVAESSWPRFKGSADNRGLVKTPAQPAQR